MLKTENNFDGRTALITGASSGIGAATAFLFGSNGAHTLVHYARNVDGASDVVERIRNAGGSANLLSADLSTLSGIQRLTETIQALQTPVDILVNNAGSLIQRKLFLEISENLWSEVFTLNLTSAFLITQAVLPSMVRRRGGWIVNVSSVAARFGGGLGAIAYSSAKAALSTMTKGLAREFGPEGIHINAVSPGTIDTNYHKKFSKPEGLAAVVAATPLQRLGTSADISDVICFLCSEGARFIHGQIIEVNGGFLMV